MVITAVGVAVAVAALFSLLTFARGYQAGIRSELDRLGAHVLLAPKGCPYDAASMALHGASWPCYLKQAYLEEVARIQGVAAAAPVFMAATHDKNSTASVYLGVQSNVLALKTGWRITGSFPSAAGEGLVGAELQKRHGWKVGEEISLPGLPGPKATVRGILAPTHSSEDAFCYLQLADAQRRFGHPNELTHILIRLTDPNEMDQVVARLRGCDAGLEMNVVPLAHVFRTIQSVVNSTQFLLASVALVALFIAGSGVSNAVMMSVSERTREIGVMRALGASQKDVVCLIWMDALQVCAVGAAAGLLVARVAAPLVESWARSKLPFAPSEALVGWDWPLAGLSLGLAILVGTLASFLPAWRAARLPPMVAIRSKEVPL